MDSIALPKPIGLGTFSLSFRADSWDRSVVGCWRKAFTKETSKFVVAAARPGTPFGESGTRPPQIK